jgi:RTA1 like protein
MPFVIQIVCLTIAPAFYAAGIYFCLSRIVTVFGVENSRVSAKTYPILFISCDFVSLLLQSIGGGMAASATHELKDPKNGELLLRFGTHTTELNVY